MTARRHYPELKDLDIALDTLDMTLTGRKVVFAKVRSFKTVAGDDRWIIFMNRKVLAHKPPREFLVETLCHELEHILNGDVSTGHSRAVKRPHAGGRIDKAVQERVGGMFDVSERWKKQFVETAMRNKT